MLEIAYIHNAELQEKFAQIAFNERYKYYWRNGRVNYGVQILSDSWDKLQFVSINEEGQLVGYLACDIARYLNYAYNFEVISFVEGRNETLSKDMHNMIAFVLHEMKMDKIVWSVVEGNPIQTFYDRMVEVHGVRKVGTFKNDCKLWDGTVCDVTYYEHLREVHEENRQKAINKDNYRYYRKGE